MKPKGKFVFRVEKLKSDEYLINKTICIFSYFSKKEERLNVYVDRA